MTIRARFKLDIALSSSSNEEKDLGNLNTNVFSDAFGEGGVWKTVVPLSSTDLQLTIPNFDDIGFLAIRTTSTDPTLSPVDIILKLNDDTNDPITISPMGPSTLNPKEGWLMLTTSGVTALYATNSSTTTDMNVTVFMCGDIP